MQAPRVKGFGNEETYLVHTATPIQQTLDDKFFEWLSGKYIKEIGEEIQMRMETLVVDGTIEITTAVEVVQDFVGDLLANADAMQREFCQVCENYTDWTHLTRRLCENFGLAIDMEEGQK